MNWSYRRTFTLIEMLIVIVIIGILAAALIPKLQSLQARARDTRRKIDIKVIFDAAHVYLADNNKYPIHQNTYAYFGCGGNANTGYNNNCMIWSSYDKGTWIRALLSYLNPIPYDPINFNAEFAYWTPFRTGYYNYYYWNVWTFPYENTFDLWARLETRTDPDRCAARTTYGSYPKGAICNTANTYGRYDNGQIYEYSPHSN